MNDPDNDLSPIERQPHLFSDEELNNTQAEEPSPQQAGRFTAAAFLHRYPHKYQMAIELLGAGHPKIQIARLLQCSVHTLLAIEDQNPQPIAQAKAKQLQRLVAGSGLVLESILEDFADPEKREKIPTGTKGVIYGILHDKMQLGSGQPTQIVQHLESRPSHADAAAYAEAMEEAETVEESSAPYDAEEMDLPQEDRPPKRADDEEEPD